MKVLIQEREEEAKYAQSERELLEKRILELEELLGGVKEELKNKSDDYDALRARHEKL